MAIEKYHITEQAELVSILSGMKDADDDPFFDNVRLETGSGGVNYLHFEENEDDTLTTRIKWDIRTSGTYRSQVYVYYKEVNTNRVFKLAPVTYPFDLYLTRHGFLADLYDGTYQSPTKKYPFGICKSAAGSLLAFGCPYSDYVYTTETTTRKTIVLCPDAYFWGTGTSAGVVDGQPMTFTDPNMDHSTNMQWTTLIELPVYSTNPMDHMDKTYLVYNNQTTLGEFGYFIYQGHTYLTNGFWAILDT